MPRTMSASASIHPAWQMAATGLSAWCMSRVRATIPGLVRILSGEYPPGITRASNSAAPTWSMPRSMVTGAPCLPVTCFAGLQANDHGLMPGASDAVVGHLELGVLKQLVKDERHSRHVSVLLLLDLSPASGRRPPVPGTPGTYRCAPRHARRQQASRVDCGIVRRAGYSEEEGLFKSRPQRRRDAVVGNGGRRWVMPPSRH